MFPYAEYITSKYIYFRFHGPAALYASGYSVDKRIEFAEKIVEWKKKGKVVWAFLIMMCILMKYLMPRNCDP